MCAFLKKIPENVPKRCEQEVKFKCKSLMRVCVCVCFVTHKKINVILGFEDFEKQTPSTNDIQI